MGLFQTDYSVAAAADRKYEAQRQQERLSEESALRRQIESQSIQKFSLENCDNARQIDQKTLTAAREQAEFNIKAGIQSADESRAQGQWLASRADVSSRRSSQTYQEEPLANESQGRGVVSSDLRQNLQIASAAKQTTSNSPESLSILPRQKNVLTEGEGNSSQKLRISFEEAQRSIPEKSVKDSSSFGDGTPAATQKPTISQDPSKMPFNSQFDTQQNRQRSWQKSSFISEDDLSAAASAALRQGAIVERPQDYAQISVNETFLPRMAELIKRLSTMGQSWVRVVVPLDGRTNVVVRFNNQSGRVKIHIESPSDNLSNMIRAGWSGLTGDLAGHGIALDQPTFETPKYDN